MTSRGRLAQLVRAFGSHPCTTPQVGITAHGSSERAARNLQPIGHIGRLMILAHWIELKLDVGSVASPSQAVYGCDETDSFFCRTVS
jgi:hypothetical protein